MSTEGSVSLWLRQLKEGDTEAAQQLWERYVRLLVARITKRWGGGSRGIADGEEVALVAFENFCRAVQRGRLPKLDDRTDLWQVLVAIADRRAIDAVRRQQTRRQHEVGESVLMGVSPDAPLAQQQAARDPEPTVDQVVEMQENFERLLLALDDDSLRDVARWKIEGYTNAEIAQKMGCVPRTIERKLSRIRQRWEQLGLGPG